MVRSGLPLIATVALGVILTRAQGPVTFNEHVAPVILNSCAGCHRPGEAAPFPLMTYQDARPRGRRIAAVTQSRAMPPWKAGPSDYEFSNARRLTEAQIATIQQWVNDGLLEGDPGKLPAMPPFTEGWQLGQPDLVVTMNESFEVAASGPDIYRTFVVPLGLEHDTWVRAIEFRPSARAVVHHSLFFLDTTGGARELDARDPLPGFAGGMGGARLVGRGRGTANLTALAGLLAPSGASDARDDRVARAGGLGGWAVGGRALELPPSLAFFVPRDSDLILSTHFHPSGAPHQEKSSVGLYFAEKPPTQAFTTIQLPPIFGLLEGLDIPAGEPRYSISDSFTLPVDVRAFAVGAHAHYLGKEIKLTATLPDGSRRMLLWIEDWDFSWQERYSFKDFVPLPTGTRLDATISYDNSAANKRNPSRPPVRVAWGEESTDEMGSVGLQVVTADPNDLPELRQAFAAHVRQAALTRPGLGQLLRRRADLLGPPRNESR